MNDKTEIKTVMSCSDVARLVGLSRQRFRQLVNAGVFPSPLYDVRTRRPFYTEKMASQCQDVRQRNMGINGQPVLFYAKRQPISSPAPKRSQSKDTSQKYGEYADLIEPIKALGLVSVTSAQIEAAVKNLYPNGTGNVNQGEVIRAVFLHLQRKDV